MLTETRYSYNNIEIWGGLECTINRTEDGYRDQLSDAGHYARPGDIKEIAGLGIKKIRYPLLWEKHQPTPNGRINWKWAEARLQLIRDHGIEPIIGLLHHGSGPEFTNLLDNEFAEKLALYASKVARRFPWLEYYTPVNEPLTTARFSALYGFWYPHEKEEQAFLRALFNQIKGTILSMQAIRRINPNAKLVQTEDLAKIHSSPSLRYQANYENERRWLTYDLLCGKVDEEHFFWDDFIAAGITEDDLYFIIENACPPDICGFNYYVTSERYLDDRLENYPAFLHGGNGKMRYADTEAVRMNAAAGLSTLLNEAWERYRLPMAITECHLSCTREEQMRWFNEVWNTCNDLKRHGKDIRAITAWALLGAYDWDSLLLRRNGNYEPGVFDIRGGKLRPTALYPMIRDLALTGNHAHPLLLQNGWWNRNQVNGDTMNQLRHTRPLLIIGRTGTLGHAFTRVCEQRSIPYFALTRKELDISSMDDIHRAILQFKPWAIINAAGFVRVDDAEINSEDCFTVNAVGPGLLAAACAQQHIRFMTFSTDLVFDGNKKAPYHENDPVNPLNIYGASKAEGEQRTLSGYPDALVIRTSAFFGPWDKYNFVYNVLESLKRDELLELPSDVIVSPTYVPDLADTSLDLLIDGEKGIWHLTNDGMISWAEFGFAVAHRAGFTDQRIQSVPLGELGWKATRPLYSVLQSEKGVKLPVLDHALVRYFEQQEL
jgi:dTDP-4-dehydrorhamnose reductase